MQNPVCGDPMNQEDTPLEQPPLGRNIRRLRLEKHMTQRYVAHRLRVSAQAVSKWERGRAFPDLTLLPLLADLFEITLDELFGRCGGA